MEDDGRYSNPLHICAPPSCYPVVASQIPRLQLSSSLSSPTQGWPQYGVPRHSEPGGSPLTPSTVGPVTPSPTFSPVYPALKPLPPGYDRYGSYSTSSYTEYPTSETELMSPLGHSHNERPSTYGLGDVMHGIIDRSKSYIPTPSVSAQHRSMVEEASNPWSAYSSLSSCPNPGAPGCDPPFSQQDGFSLAWASRDPDAIPPLSSSAAVSVPDSASYHFGAGIVDESAPLPLEEAPLGAYDGQNNFDFPEPETPRFTDIVDSRSPLVASNPPKLVANQMQSLQTVRHRRLNCSRKSSGVPIPDVGPVPKVVSYTVAKPTVLGASLARRKKPGKYLCDLCPADFTEKHGLQNHVNAHYGVRPYACHGCNKTFTTSHTRNRHLKTCRFCQSEQSDITFVNLAQ